MSTDGNNSTGTAAEVVGLVVVMRVMVGRCYYPWTESYGVHGKRLGKLASRMAFLLERGRRQLYLCREGSMWVGLLLSLHV